MKRFWTLLVFFALTLSILISPASPVFAAVDDWTKQPTVGASKGNGLIIKNPNYGIQADVGVGSGIALNAIANGATPKDYALHFPIIHPEYSCITMSFTHYVRNQSSGVANYTGDKLYTWDNCDGDGTNGIQSIIDLNDATYKSWYVASTSGLSPFYAGTYANQGTYTDDFARVRVTQTSVSPNCWNGQIWNRLTLVWDSVGQSCGLENIVNNGQAYILFQQDGTELASTQQVDLGTRKLITVQDIKYQSTSGGGWTSVSSITNAIPSVASPYYDPFYNNMYLMDWGYNTPAGSADKLLVCGKAANQARCNYSHVARGYAGIYPPSTITKEFVIQRTSDGRIDRNNVGVVQASSTSYKYYAEVYQLDGASEIVLNVNDNTHQTILGGGYHLQTGAAAPTCTWPTATTYKCVAAAGTTLNQIWVEVDPTSSTGANPKLQGSYVSLFSPFTFTDREYDIN